MAAGRGPVRPQRSAARPEDLPAARPARLRPVRCHRAPSVGALLGWLALGALLGCAGTPELPAIPPSPPKPSAAAEWAPDRPRAPRAPPPELCPTLAGVLEPQVAGFAPLRGDATADGRWSGTAILPGTERCSIQGGQWPGARYACTSGPVGSGPSAQARFDTLARELDACLAKPIWFPRIWQKGEPFEFAMGERMLIWTDRSTAPPSQVVLKIQRAIGGPDYQVMVDLGTAP